MDNRNRLILELLIMNNNEYDFTSLRDYLDITEKTLTSDLKKLNIFLKTYESELYVENRTFFLRSLYGKIDWINILKINSNITDEDKVIICILLEKNNITIAQIAENYYISRSKVEKIIKSFDIKPLTWNNKRNSGLNISGSEVQKLTLCVDILESHVDDLNYIVTTKLILQKIFSIYIDNTKFESIVELHYKYIKMYDNVNEIKVKKLFILLCISKLFDYNYELIYDSYVEKLIYKVNLNDKLKNDINLMLDLNYISYDSDDTTYKQLYQHLNKLIFHYDSRDRVELDTDVEGRFTYAYELSREMLHKYNIIDPSELELVTIYIQTLMNKTKNKINYVDINVVSQYGNSIMEYITTKISNNINLGIKFHRYSISDVLNNCVMKGNITITTLSNLELANTFYVKPLPSDEEIIKLCLMIKNKVTLLKVNDLIDGNYFIIDESNDINSLKENIFKIMKEQNLVTKDYYESFDIRLSMDFSVVNESIFLHGNSSFVNQNKILVFLVKDGIPYQGQDIKIVFVILLTNEYLSSDSKLIKNIYKILMQKESIEILIKSMNINYLKYSLNSSILLDE